MSKLPRNLLAVYAAHAVNGVLGVIAVPAAVKLLGIEGYGLLSIYALMVSYILLADFGIGKNLLRLLAERREAGEQVRQLRVALGLYGLLCGAWIAAAPLLALAAPRYIFPVPGPAMAAVRWIAILSIAEFVLGIPASLMQTACVAGQRFDRYSRFSMVSAFLRNGIILAGAWAFRSPEAIAFLLAARKIAEIWIARRLLGPLPPGSWRPLFDRKSLRAMLGQSATLSLAQVSYSSVMSAGSLLVNAAFGLHGLGLYRAAYDLAGKIAFVANGATLVVFPRAARYFGGAERPQRAGAMFSDLFLCSAAGYACFAAMAVAAAPSVLPAIGLQDGTIVRLFMILVVGLSINAHSLLANELIQASGRYRYNLYFSLSTLAALILLFFAARPFAGLMAIAWAWVGAGLVSACVADGLLLDLVATPPARQFASVAVKLLATAACAVLAASRSGILAGAAAVLGALAIGVILLLAVPRAASLIRAWTGSAQTAEPAAQAVCT